MKVLIGTAFSFGVGGLRSHIESLRQALTTQNVYNELVYSDNITYWSKGIAALRALGSLDRARVELRKIRTYNVGRKVQATISKGNYDLFHCHDALLTSWAVDLSVPVILTVHGPLAREAATSNKGTPTYLAFLKEVEQHAYRTARAIIAVDTGQKELLISDYHVPGEKVKVIYNAVDTELFAPRPSQPVKSKPYFLVPRRLVPKNGVHVAIESLRFTEDDETELWIAGDGSERDSLEKLAAELNLATRVRFLGSVDKKTMVKLINESTGVIIPSVPVAGVVEATSIAALEGMSMGKPVFASDVGGLSEIIKNNETGFLFSAGDAEILGMLLRQALKNAEWLRSIGSDAREYVLANHSMDVWIKKVLGVYKSTFALEKCPQTFGKYEI